MADRDAIGTPLVEEHRSWRPSLVWLAPLIALAISLGIAWKTYSEQGPTIEIVFNNAAGIVAQKTSLKHKDVQIGMVEDVGFTENLAEVLVTARIDPEVADYLDESARFWVVRPEVSVRGISGLDTVLSGPYIQVGWDDNKGEPKRRFNALRRAPLSNPGEKGVRVRLRANDGGSMVVGAPVLYKRIEVGKVETKELSPDGQRVDFNVFIREPHDKLLTTATRFWNLSGIAVEIGADGAKLKVDSLASLLQGGIAFDTVATDGAPVDPLQAFVLYSNEVDARRSVFSDDPRAQIRLSIEFESSVRGLKIGAPVEYRGLRVGEVTDVAAKVRTEDGITDISLIVTIVVQPGRLGLPTTEEDETLRFLKRQVSRGLRAKLASASLLTGALYIELVEQPDAPVALLDELTEPYPRLPSVPSDFEDFTASAEGVLNRINSLPVEELMYSATELLRNVNALVTAEGTTAVPEHLAGLLRDARSLINDDDLRAVPGDVGATIKAARQLVEEIQKAGAAEALVAALKDAQLAAQAVSAASANIPDLVTQASTLSANINDLPLEKLVTTATILLEDLDKVATAEGIEDIPVNLNESLAAVRLIVTDLRDAKAAKNLAAALKAAREAAVSINTAAAETPKLIARFEGIAANVEELPLDALIASAQKLIDDADRIVADEGIQAAPKALADTLETARALLNDLREAGAAQKLADALVEARVAAQSFSGTMERTPALIQRLNVLADKATALPLENLLNSTTVLVQDADRILRTSGAERIPGSLTAALDEIRVLTAQIRERGTTNRFNTAMVSFDQASRSFQTLSANLSAALPALVRVAEQADSVLSSFDVGSELNYEAVTALREVRDAARAITALAATVERRPNSLILGK